VRIFRPAFGLLVAAPAFMGASLPLYAETASASLGVTIVLRTFSEAVTADHRCTHRGQADGDKATLRISCPATVDVQAIASASSSKTGQAQRMNAVPGATDRSSQAVVAGAPMHSAEPVELTISW
jgi:hypothetical protein